MERDRVVIPTYWSKAISYMNFMQLKISTLNISKTIILIVDAATSPTFYPRIKNMEDATGRLITDPLSNETRFDAACVLKYNVS